MKNKKFIKLNNKNTKEQSNIQYKLSSRLSKKRQVYEYELEQMWFISNS